jgi:penicillin-binding protein 2
VIFLFASLIGRIWYLQIFQGRKFKQFSEENRIELRKVPAMRGRILDRRGAVIADSRASFDLKLRAHYVEDLSATMERLGGLLSLDGSVIHKVETRVRANNPYESIPVKQDMSRDELARILVRQYSFPGVDIVHTPARSYPFGDHGSHLLGYLGEISKKDLAHLKEDGDATYDQGDVWGISGVEKEYDVELRGESGSQPYVEDAKGRELGIESSGDLLPAFQPRDPTRGLDLVLAIDAKVQETAEQAFTGQSGAVIALDPNNGDVLALLSRPEYSPEKFVRGVSSDYWGELMEDSRNPLYDRALRGLYPPGSTFKIVTAAAALTENVVTPEEKIFCPGTYRLGREVKHCWKKGGHGYMNFRDAIKHSCDVYFYEMGRRLGVDRIAKYAKAFGMGRATDIGINREENGLVPTEAWKRKVYNQPWVGGETLSVAIGQGFLQITPIQMAVALSAIVNGGRVFRPRIALRTQDDEKRLSEEFKVEEKSNTQLPEKTVLLIRDALGAVVNEPGGTAYGSRSLLVQYGGKTGTAQAVGLSSAVKLGDHAWFIAYAPVEQPKIVVTVIVEHGGHGASVAAPIAKKVIEAYLGGTS